MELPETPRRPPESCFERIRGLDLHCLQWPGTGAPIVLLHGFLDCASTFQFVVDALRLDRPVCAPDWRGFGLSAWAPDGYWFPDYYGDLDAWLEVLSPDMPADVVGHSMGGNVALTYAGLRPSRVRRLIALESFGLPPASPDLAPVRYREWLDQLRRDETGPVFPSLDVLVRVIQRRDPRLTAARARFVAAAWAEVLPDARARLRHDPAHKRVNPVLYRREEAEACWREIRAPVLAVIGAESDFLPRRQGPDGIDSMRKHIPQLEERTVAGAGHMLHHDQPAAVAAVIDEFLA
jgi:pimeloyl-ACP methyl ester carboxylesterase